MRNNWLLRVATFLFVLLLIAVLAWLTLTPPDDPCVTPRVDIGAAVLADEPTDQDALVNRAIIMRGDCEDAARTERREEQLDQ
jgi:hypothetical protein